MQAIFYCVRLFSPAVCMLSEPRLQSNTFCNLAVAEGTVLAVCEPLGLKYPEACLPDPITFLAVVSDSFKTSQHAFCCVTQGVKRETSL